MHLPEIVLHEPADLPSAAAILTRLGPHARVMAGGTDLLTDLKTGRIPPCELVSLARIAGLAGIKPEPHGGLWIGAMTTIAELAESPLLVGPFEVLADAARGMAAPPIRHSATLGGNVAGAVPCADMPPALGVLGATVILWSASAGAEREVAVESYCLAPRQGARRADEIITGLRVPNPGAGGPPGRFAAAYARFALREGNAIAVAAVAASLVLDANRRVHSPRLMLGAVAPIPKRATGAEGLLAGRSLDDAIDAAATRASTEAEPISDLRGSAAYRRELVAVLAHRALSKAHQRALETAA